MGKPTAKIPEPPTFDEQRLCKSICYHALEKIAGKETERGVLETGKQYEVELDLQAIVNGYRVAYSHEGKLAVGFDGQATSKLKPSAMHVLALAIARLAKTKKAAREFFDQLPEEFRAAKQLPEADPELLQECQELLDALTTSVQSPRKGAVSFTHAAPPPQP